MQTNLVSSCVLTESQEGLQRTRRDTKNRPLDRPRRQHQTSRKTKKIASKAAPEFRA